MRLLEGDARSASISARSYCRWPPAVRRGCGKPKRRSHERSVFGLTPSIAAAAFVRIDASRGYADECVELWCRFALQIAQALLAAARRASERPRRSRWPRKPSSWSHA